MCAMVKSRYIGDGHPTFNDGILSRWVYKPLRTWVDEFIPYYMEIMEVDRPDRTHTWRTLAHLGLPFLPTNHGSFVKSGCISNRIVTFQTLGHFTLNHDYGRKCKKYATLHSGQILIFHQPRFPWNKGKFPYFSPPFGVTNRRERSL